MGRAASYGKLMLALTRDNVNAVSPSEATALMIVAAGVGNPFLKASVLVLC